MIKANRIKIVILVILIVGGFIYYNNQKKVLTIGIFAGSNWDVPTFDYYKMIDETIARFEKEHPNVEVKYQSGILKEDYSLWLSQQLLTGNEPDLYMILNEDFNSLASLGALKNLDQIIKSDDDFDVDKFYQNTLEIGKYQGNQYALPYEVNPTLMFVNKTLLEKEGVSLPENDWTLDDFYNICKQITKDTDNDGIIDQYGYYNYTWLDAIYAGGINIFNESGTSCDLNNSKVKEAVQFIEKINLLNQGFNVTSNDFDQGKVAFAPMQFSQYRTYKPYPYRVSKFSTFEWDVIEMPQQTDAYLTQLSSLMIGLSTRSSNGDLAWQLLKEFTYNETSQQDIYKYSQGVSPLKSVTESEDILKLLEEDTMGDSNIDMSVLNKVMEYPTINTGFKKYEGVMRIVDNQITKTLQNNADLDTALIALQREINNYLNE
ncbi:ABC transporter substrate-binding protein [Thomasclavelia saccharogumia]|uniref:ABC transporter substrate-binding protein n=1 Tax=Thomasclavelia saccharogumia TaxID=341225 RepID=UPI00047BE9BF|nr:sugar ABC transporter substrate-binding protein [Thomasclavelia saccharogumia]